MTVHPVRRWRRLNLLARFTLIGAFAGLLAAGSLGWFIEVRLTESMLQQIAARAADQIELGVLGRVTEADFESPLTPERLDDLAERLTPLLARVRQQGSGVIRLHVFARDGTVVYSDLVSKQGQSISPSAVPLLAGALAGSVGTKISTLSSPESADLKERYDRALEVYVPLVLDGQVVAAYEMYQNLAPIRWIRPLVWGSVAGGFLILFLSLLAVVSSAAAHIRPQQVDRESLIRQAADSEQRALRRSKERLRAIVENASDVIAILDADGTLHYQSPAAQRGWGYQPEALSGANILGFVHPEDLAAARLLLAQAVASLGMSIASEARLRHADGTWRDFEIIVANSLTDPAVGGIVATYHDITERKAFERQLTRLAFYDSLTGLPNRPLFLDPLEHALARARPDHRSIAVLFLDPDNFKVINDSLGHKVGDQLLVAVGERLSGPLRAEDTVARLGGDEFTVLLEDLPAEDHAIRVAERIVDAMRAPFNVDGNEVFATASIGIARRSPLHNSPDTLLRDADLAMYKAKANGKARYEVFDQSMTTRALERLGLEGDLHRALERNEFLVYYQPIISLGTGVISEVEALLRWAHPERGLVTPAHFIPVAEETGLIVPFGRWVLEEACRQARAWQTQQMDASSLVMSVNLSARQVQDPGLVEEVARVLRQTSLDPAYLRLEITETDLMQDLGTTIATLRALKGIGVRLAIDDFGTGYSSLSYLSRFPVDTLKIDRSFIDGVGREARNTALIRSVIAMAKNLSLTVTSEGIEDADQLAHLQALGCDLGQGYFFARPSPPEVFVRLLAQSRQSSGQLSAAPHPSAA